MFVYYTEKLHSSGELFQLYFIINLHSSQHHKRCQWCGTRAKSQAFLLPLSPVHLPLLNYLVLSLPLEERRSHIQNVIISFSSQLCLWHEDALELPLWGFPGKILPPGQVLAFQHCLLKNESSKYCPLQECGWQDLWLPKRRFEIKFVKLN